MSQQSTTIEEARALLEKFDVAVSIESIAWIGGYLDEEFNIIYSKDATYLLAQSDVSFTQIPAYELLNIDELEDVNSRYEAIRYIPLKSKYITELISKLQPAANR